MTRLLHHIRQNVVAYIALFVALGGTSYAALSLPNHSVDPVKLNPRFIAANVRGWAEVQDGKIFGGAGHPRLVTQGEPFGRIGLTWRTAIRSNCAAIATVARQGLGPGAPSTAGYATAIIARFARRWGVNVTTYTALGQETPLPFSVAVIC